MKRTTEINKEIGKAIRKAMRRRGMTQVELANIVGSSQRSISAYVTGETMPPLDILRNICLELEINIAQVLEIPEFQNPNWVIKDQEEMEFLSLLEGLTPAQKKQFIQAAKQMRKLVSVPSSK